MATTDDQDSTQYMLTTVDNPYDPFTQWPEWYSFDTLHGYHTCSLLARLTYTSDELSDADQDIAVQMAMDEIVQENVSGMHRKVSRENVATLLRKQNR